MKYAVSNGLVYFIMIFALLNINIFNLAVECLVFKTNIYNTTN